MSRTVRQPVSEPSRSRSAQEARRSDASRGRAPSGRRRRFAEALESLRPGAPDGARPSRDAWLPGDPRLADLGRAQGALRPRRHALPPEAFEGVGLEADPFARLRRDAQEPPTRVLAEGELAAMLQTPGQPALHVPAPQAVSQAAQSGSALAHAQAAALAERLVSSIRLGRVGRDGHVAELRLASGVAVRLRHEGGRLAIEVDPDPHAYDEALALMGRLREELKRRGVEPDVLDLV